MTKSRISKLIVSVLLAVFIFISGIQLGVSVVDIKANAFYSYTVTSNTSPANTRVVKETLKYSGSDVGLVTDYKYNSNGNLTKITVKYIDGTLSGETLFSYDSSNRLVKKTGKNASGTVAQYEYKYNNAGQLTKETEKTGSGFSVTTSYTYDKNGALTGRVEKNNTGRSDKYTYTYDENGNLLNSKGCERSYDANNRLIKRVKRDIHGKIEQTESFTYNSKGELTKKTVKFADGQTESNTYTYNSNGMLTKDVYKFTRANGKSITQTVKYTYNSKGLLTKELNETDSGVDSTVSYVYDKNGVLVKRVTKYSSGREETASYTYGKDGISRESFNGAENTVVDYKNIALKETDLGNGYAARLSYSSCTYSGKAKTPDVIISDIRGNVLRRGVDFRVSYSSNNAPGTANVNITFAGRYEDLGSFKLKFTIKPGVPSGIKASANRTNSIVLTWKDVPGANAYEVYKYNKTSSSYELYTTVSSASAAVKGLYSGTGYKFKIRAVDDSGKIKGNFSKEFSTTTKCKAVSAEAASASKGNVKISWNKVTGADSYTVYYSTSKTGTYKELKTVSATTLTSKTLSSGKIYYIKVVANRSFNGKTYNSADSNTVSVKVK